MSLGEGEAGFALSAIRFTPPFFGPFPYLQLPAIRLYSSSTGFVSYLPPATQTRDCKTNPKLDPPSDGDSIDAIPSCAHFTAYRFPKLDRVDPGTEARKKRANTIQLNSNRRSSPMPSPAGARGPLP